MIEQLLRGLVEHKRRKTIVTFITVLMGLLVVLPATDEYNAARERVHALRTQLLEMEAQSAELPKFQEMAAARMAELKEMEVRAVSETTAERLQSQLVEMVRQSGCTMRQIRPGQSLRRDWTSKDDPIYGVNLSDRGEATPYQLETRQISLSVTGSMKQLLDFMATIHRLDHLIHGKQVSLKRADERGTTAVMEMDLLLFNLVLKRTA